MEQMKKPRSKNSGFRSASPFGGVGPTYICSICKKRTRETGHDESSCELCKSCYLKELMINEHSDYGHDQPVDGCPSCKHEAEWEAENDMSWAEHKKIEQQKLEEKRNKEICRDCGKVGRRDMMGRCPPCADASYLAYLKSKEDPDFDPFRKME